MKPSLNLKDEKGDVSNSNDTNRLSITSPSQGDQMLKQTTKSF